MKRNKKEMKEQFIGRWGWHRQWDGNGVADILRNAKTITDGQAKWGQATGGSIVAKSQQHIWPLHSSEHSQWKQLGFGSKNVANPMRMFFKKFIILQTNSFFHPPPHREMCANRRFLVPSFRNVRNANCEIFGWKVKEFPLLLLLLRLVRNRMNKNWENLQDIPGIIRFD